ncbi:MAG: N-formylglutamate amidohydrolase [Candidatus Pacebacteria bacterium]|nr:N-formylglutamate amidohydrolase [Candidatus Paceibacterota bacterium]
MRIESLENSLPILPVLRGRESQSQPLIIALPHSGRVYPPQFLAESRLGLERLRTMEDFDVDHLFAAATEFGAVSIFAPYARVWLDVNRRVSEIDPALVVLGNESLQYEVTHLVKNGIGLIPRLVAGSEPIYRQKLTLAEVQRRIDLAYHPYHLALTELIAATVARFGSCRIIDAHSMPSRHHRGEELADFVLGDAHGVSCSPAFLGAVAEGLMAEGFSVAVNQPYAGGFTTQNYGRPSQGVEVLQLEINRRLYMDESRVERLPVFEKVKQSLERIFGRLR